MSLFVHFKSKSCRSILVILSLLGFVGIGGAENKHSGGVIWVGQDSVISYEELAQICAPVLWFSPDEQTDKEKEETKLPQNFPFDNLSAPNSRVVYYRPTHIHLADREKHSDENENIDLKNTDEIMLEYLFYYPTETGLGEHPHDIESAEFQLEILINDTSKYPYQIRLMQVTGRAHGNYWYNNILRLPESFGRKDALDTKFPVHLLVEEGKHATCPDRNIDGVYTHTFDVNRKVTDTWGIRDVMRTGHMYTPAYQDWMAKNRHKKDRVFPLLPTREGYKYYDGYKDEQKEAYSNQCVYELRKYPLKEEWKKKLKIFRDSIKCPCILDEKLLEKEKQFAKYPRIESKRRIFSKWWDADEFSESLAISGRFNKDTKGIGFSIGFPFWLLKNCEVPVVNGLVFHKIFFATNVRERANQIGIQILYSRSASRWFDWYFGLGGEKYWTQEKDPTKYNLDKKKLVTEAGIKTRIDVRQVKFKYLKWVKYFRKVTRCSFNGILIGVRTAEGPLSGEQEWVFEIGGSVW